MTRDKGTNNVAFFTMRNHFPLFKAEPLSVCIFYTLIGGICNKRKMDNVALLGRGEIVTVIPLESEPICRTAALEQKAGQK